MWEHRRGRTWADEDTEDVREKPRAQTDHTDQSGLLCRDLPGICDSVSLSITEAECKKCCLTVAEFLPLWGPSDTLSQDEVWMTRKRHVWGLCHGPAEAG